MVLGPPNGQWCQSCPKVSAALKTCIRAVAGVASQGSPLESTCLNKAEKDHFIFPPAILHEEKAHTPILYAEAAYYLTLFKERQTPNYKLNTLRATLLLMHYLLNICFSLRLKAGHYFSWLWDNLGSVKVSKPICSSSCFSCCSEEWLSASRVISGWAMKPLISVNTDNAPGLGSGSGLQAAQLCLSPGTRFPVLSTKGCWPTESSPVPFLSRTSALTVTLAF